MPSILCSNARAPVAQLVRASDRQSEDPGSNPGWISMSFFAKSYIVAQFLLPSPSVLCYCLLQYIYPMNDSSWIITA